MRVTGLECRLGLGRIVLPVESIVLLGEYAVGSRLPLNDRINYAIGVWDDAAILSVSLSRHEPSVQRKTHGVLLSGSVHRPEPDSIQWAFEIDEPIGLVEVIELAKPTAAMPWRRSAKLADGRAIQFIDIPMMFAELVTA
jgi:hypothetical protein